MLQVIYFFIGLVIAVIMESVLLSASSIHIEGKVVFTIILFAIFVIWGAILINLIKDFIDAQLQNLHSIQQYKARKESYEAELIAYKAEMQQELLERYREFEKTLMENVKDSKIIAAVLQQSGYSEVLTSYNKMIKNLLEYINGCDRSIADSMADMRVRQDSVLSGYASFIPKRLFFDIS